MYQWQLSYVYISFCLVKMTGRDWMQDRVPRGGLGSLVLALPSVSDPAGPRPSISWKVLLCFPHTWWICMAASRSAARSKSCCARWALNCLISNWKTWKQILRFLEVHTLNMNTTNHICLYPACRYRLVLDQFPTDNLCLDISILISTTSPCR